MDLWRAIEGLSCFSFARYEGKRQENKKIKRSKAIKLPFLGLFQISSYKNHEVGDGKANLGLAQICNYATLIWRIVILDALY